MQSHNEKPGLRTDRLVEGWEVSPQDVRARLQPADAAEPRSEPPILLLDCRRADEWRTARIDRAMHVPMEEIRARLPELEAFAEREIIVYCHHGRRSLSVTEFLRTHGFERVHSMAGGIDRWSREVDNAVPRY